jgi:PAS domain-containing protein
MDPRHPDLELDFLATVFEVARIGICVVDEAGMFVRVNPAFCAMVAGVKERFLEALLADSPKIPREWEIRRRDGKLSVVH